MKSNENLMSNLAATLDEGELDQLKYFLSRKSILELENDFEISHDPKKRKRFYESLEQLTKIQPFSNRLKPYSISYIGRPDFMTSDLLSALQQEAEAFRPQAWPNFKQFMYQPNTPKNFTHAEKLADSTELFEFVQKHAGPCLKSYLSSYIYYDQLGHSSALHVDNDFTSITAMLGLRHDCDQKIFSSRTVFYWPERERLDFQLRPGEMAIFIGVSAVHGRTPVAEGETVHSLLMSFRPNMDKQSLEVIK